MTANNMRDDWWKQAVVYQIYPRSFKDVNMFVQDYETWLKAQGLSVSTTAFYLSQLCAFYKQAVKRGKTLSFSRSSRRD